MSINLTEALHTIQGPEFNQQLLGTGFDLPMNAEGLAAAIIIAATPDAEGAYDFVVTRCAMTNDSGQTFLQILTKLFSMKPSDMDVISISICQDFCKATIEYIYSSEEFTGGMYHGKGFRRDAVISGYTLATLSLKLRS